MYKILGTDQKEYGPVSADQLRKWLAENRVNYQTRVLPVGSTEWQTLGSLPELAGAFVAGPPPLNPGPDGSGLNTVIPYKNPKALIAYYLAIFSLIPILGMPLGLAALVLGILGLRFRRTHPTAGGAAHAWVGIILGGLCGFVYLALIVLGFIGAIAAANGR